MPTGINGLTVSESLNALEQVDGAEKVKFLWDVLDALFSTGEATEKGIHSPPIKTNKHSGHVFLRGRHFNFSVCLLTQNVFHDCKFYRTVALNCTHNILFRMRDIEQINCFSQTFLTKGDVEKFILLYKHIVIREKYRYILIDFTTLVEDLLSFPNYYSKKKNEHVLFWPKRAKMFCKS